MKNRHIPPALEGLRDYLELEVINWRDSQIGSEVVVEAFNPVSQEQGSFGFTVVDLRNEDNGLYAAYVELKDNDFPFVLESNRQPVKLPGGTLLKGGVACQHFPETSAFMSRFGGISVGRDYSFDEVMTPDGEYLSTVLVPRVRTLHSFLPDGEYTPPETFVGYRQKVAEVKNKEQEERDESVRQMDEQIAAMLPEFFEDEATREELLDILATFHPEARYNLVVLMEHSQENGVLNRYMEVLKHAIEEEFRMAPAGTRGILFFPASKRGFNLMIKELGLDTPRQSH